MDQTFVKLVIPAAEIEKMSEKDRRQFLTLTIIMRDLDLLEKMLFFCTHDSEKGNRVEEAAFMVGSFFLLKTLISKCHELWTFFEKEGYLENKQALSTKTFEGLSILEQYYGDQDRKIFCFIRNKFGFHYGRDPYLETKINDAMIQEGDYQMWLENSSRSGNEVFESSANIMLRVLFDEMRNLGFQGSNDELFRKLLGKTKEFARIAKALSISLVTNDILKGIDHKKVDQITFSLPKIKDVHLPFIAAVD